MLRGTLYRKSLFSHFGSHRLANHFSLPCSQAHSTSQSVEGEADSPTVNTGSNLIKGGDDVLSEHQASSVDNNDRKHMRRNRYDISQMKNKMRELHSIEVPTMPSPGYKQPLVDKPAGVGESKQESQPQHPPRQVSNGPNLEESEPLSKEAIEEKYDFLKWKPDKGRYDKILQQHSGFIRLDSMNNPQGFTYQDFTQSKSSESAENEKSFANIESNVDKLTEFSEDGRQNVPEIVRNIAVLEAMPDPYLSEPLQQKLNHAQEGTASTLGSNDLDSPHFEDSSKNQNKATIENIATSAYATTEMDDNTPAYQNSGNLFDQIYFPDEGDVQKVPTNEYAEREMDMIDSKSNQSSDGSTSANCDSLYPAKPVSSKSEDRLSVKDNLFDEQYFNENPGDPESSNDGNVLYSVAETSRFSQFGQTASRDGIDDSTNIHSGKVKPQKTFTSNRPKDGTSDSQEINEFDNQYFRSALVEDKSTPEDSSDLLHLQDSVKEDTVGIARKAGLSQDTMIPGTFSDNGEQLGQNHFSQNSIVNCPQPTIPQDGEMDTIKYNSLNEESSVQHSDGMPSCESADGSQSEIISKGSRPRAIGGSVSSRGANTQKEARRQEEPAPNLENPQTAYDLVMKIRKEKKEGSADKSPVPSSAPKLAKWTGEKDSHGFKILTNQTLDIQNQPRHVVLSILKNCIIYENDDLIAVDKPYGLPSHGGPGIHHSLGQLLEELTEMVDKSGSMEKLQLVHRLDKETTGVMLLAKSAQASWRLRECFKKQEVIKKYWLITKGIPNPPAGVIDIPLAEGTVQNRYRMCLRPHYSAEHKLYLDVPSSGPRFEAVTNYKVLAEEGSAALVECQPETGVKHQIRCHMAFALNTAILGDHKYSHFSKQAPQKLHPDILQRLGIRQAKVRHLAMHLHARSLVLPEFNDGQNLFISAKLPSHFVQNMKWLKLKPPKKY